ncbi:hypothetical protein A3K64_03860 [Candidatus Micrarchaeota archaeon RBG_16_36_9]|nr:MAG: hypothetical protein A3K64_03860 [Candidatus Micrarchaeota archaeon RBG_16_36_9]
MSKIMLIIIIVIVAANAAFLLLYLSISAGNQTSINTNTSQSPVVPIQNNSNQSIDMSLVYASNCINSTKDKTQNIENITNATEIETRIFDNANNLKSYLQHNWSNTFYSINGTEKDIVNKTVVSMFEIITNRGRNFNLPILCDVNGTIGKYSSCLLENVPNIPSSCYNLTINLSDCENEWANHFIMDDIQYWITPGFGTIIISSTGYNITSQIFNFTINSTRHRLESFGMEITERTFSPMVDRTIFSSTRISKDGNGGSIVYNVNLTGKKGVEYYSTAWFKKKCYDKFVIY